MDDYETRIERELAGFGRTPLAEPVPVEELRGRARRVRIGRALTGVMATFAAIAVVVAALAVVAANRSPSGRHVRVAAPSFVLGDIDTVVLSSAFDEDGARSPLPASLASVVAAVPGVQRVSGVVDTFAPLVGSFGSVRPARSEPPRTPIIFSYHQPDEVQLTGGRLPNAADEIVVDADFLSRNDLNVGDDVALHIRGVSRTMKIVGTFTLPGVDLNGIPLAAMAAQYQAPDLLLDRIDVKFGPGVDAANVRDAIAAAVGNAYTVTPPSIISFPDQRLAQLEVQHAYWSLLSPDPNERANATEGGPSPNGNAEYEKHRSEAMNAELRVENVTFLSPTTATLTYRVFYGGSPSPIVTAPQPGAATRVDGVWKLSSATLCQLAAFENIPCGSTGKVTVTPPAGWQDAAGLDGQARAVITVLADPAATADQRLAVLMFGEQNRVKVEQGLRQDAVYGESHLSILGWRPAVGGIDVLYVLVTSKGPSTPWPMIAHLVPGEHGAFVAGPQYACGITGLTSGGCYTATNGTQPLGHGGEAVTIAPAPTRP
jgi:hypothetical protein